jgi:hypothetical protein
MLAYFLIGDKLRNSSDEPSRPGLVGARELRIERDQELRLFAIGNSGRQSVALKTADIAIADLALGDHSADEFLKFCVSHCETCRTCRSFPQPLSSLLAYPVPNAIAEFVFR